jgi:hypothetical protein
MPLRDTQLDDLSEIMNDPESGGVPCTITSPSGEIETFNGFHGDIAEAIDPTTGLFISSRQVHVSVIISELIAAGFGDIRGEENEDATPWLVTVVDGNGREATFKVAETKPSNSMGLMPLTLELYDVASE